MTNHLSIDDFFGGERRAEQEHSLIWKPPTGVLVAVPKNLRSPVATIVIIGDVPHLVSRNVRDELIAQMLGADVSDIKLEIATFQGIIRGDGADLLAVKESPGRTRRMLKVLDKANNATSGQFVWNGKSSTFDFVESKDKASLDSYFDDYRELVESVFEQHRLTSMDDPATQVLLSEIRRRREES